VWGELLQVRPEADAPQWAVRKQGRDAVAPREQVLAQPPKRVPLVLLVSRPAGLRERVLPRAQAQRVLVAQAPPLSRHALRELEAQ
jgi:hypothetical protein